MRTPNKNSAGDGHSSVNHQLNMINYIQGLKDTLDQLPWKAIEKAITILWRCARRGKWIYTMGNGGHCNTAAHMINDLAKHTVSSDDKKAVVVDNALRFKTFCLNDSVSLLTGLGNDMGYDHIFSEQVLNCVEKGDVLIGISGSGNSQNVILAFEAARKCGAMTICFSGFDGGMARSVADINIIVPCRKMVQVEDVHLILSHIIADELKRLVQARQEIKG